MTALPIHPAASLFPLLGEDQLRALAEDIQAHGQRECIELYEGHVIDGRNRLKACERLGIEPETCNIEEQIDPAAYVLSKNLHRRHLTESQRALIGAEVANLFKEAAAERQRAGTLAPHGAKASDQAAKAVGVGARTVERAIKVLADGAPEVISAVRDGRLSVTVAERLVRHVPEAKRQRDVIERALTSSEVKENDVAVKREIGRIHRHEEVGPPAAKQVGDERAEAVVHKAGAKLRRQMGQIVDSWPEGRLPDLVVMLRLLADELDQSGELIRDPERAA